MHDRDGIMNPDTERGLAAALRALPQEAPQPDLWPDLARALSQRRQPSRWRYALPAALAAGIALAVLAPRWPLEPNAAPAPGAPAVAAVTPAVPTAQKPDDSAELDVLHQRSQSLERWIAAFTANAPQDSRDLMAAVEVEDLIGLVDVQLDAARGDGDALPLWRQRVALLQDLATIRGNAFAVAANDAGATRASSQMLN
jgi:hypothetical protein